MKMPNDIKLFLRDLCNPKLVVIKALYFCLLGGVVLLWPQFTIHQQHIGLTTYQTGIVSAATSAVTIIIPLLSGCIGDKLGNFKKYVSVIMLLAGVASCLFVVVPTARITNSSANTTTSTSTNGTTTSLPEVDTEALTVTFWVYLAVRVIYGVLFSTGYTLFDTIVMAQSQHDGVDYGFQRAWGTLAVILSSYLSGQLVQATGGFSILFYVSAVLQVISAGLVLLVGLEFKLPALHLTKDIITQIMRLEVVMFFIAMMASGVFFGYLETFMYRYLFSLGAPPLLIGLTVTVGAPFELVLTLLTSFLVRHTGHAPLIMLGILAHSIRLLGFSLLEDPWWVLPLEVLESMTNGVTGVAAVMYCTSLFTLETLASFRGIYALMYFGIGQLVGAMAGAELRETFGDVTAFRILSVAALIVTVVYCCAFYIMGWCRSGSLDTTSPAKPIENGAKSSNGAKGEPNSQKESGIDNPACIEDH